MKAIIMINILNWALSLSEIERSLNKACSMKKKETNNEDAGDQRNNDESLMCDWDCLCGWRSILDDKSDKRNEK